MLREAAQIDLLATTGELLEARLPSDRSFTNAVIELPKPISIIEADDFTAPIFFTATRKFEDGDPTPREAKALIQDTWHDLSQKVGSGKIQCVLVCDNLNQPKVVADTMQKLANGIPWAGTTVPFRTDILMEKERIKELSRGRRGVQIMAIGGQVNILLDCISGLVPTKEPPGIDLNTTNGQQDWDRLLNGERARALPQIWSALNRMPSPDNGADQIVFLLPSQTSRLTEVVSSEMQARWPENTVMRVLLRPFSAPTLDYFNGQVMSNAVVVVRLNGSLPLDFDMQLRLDRIGAKTNQPPRKVRRIIANEVRQPFTQWYESFGGHPLEFAEEYIGPKYLAMLAKAQKVEVFEIKSGFRRPIPASNAPTIEGYQIIQQGKTQNHSAIREIEKSLPTDMEALIAMTCLFDPVVVFRAWSGREYADFVVCFQCGEVHFSFYDSTGKVAKEGHYYFGDKSDLLALARKALPDSPVINSIR